MKKYKVCLEKKAIKQLLKLDKFDAKRIKKWIHCNLDECSDPYCHGKELKYNLSKYWRYRVGDYRLIAKIDNEKILIFIVNIGHRRDVYYHFHSESNINFLKEGIRALNNGEGVQHGLIKEDE